MVPADVCGREVAVSMWANNNNSLICLAVLPVAEVVLACAGQNSVSICVEIKPACMHSRVCQLGAIGITDRT